MVTTSEEMLEFPLCKFDSDKMEVRVEDDQEDREGRQNQDLVGQENQIIYSVEEAPPPHLTLVFALQVMSKKFFFSILLSVCLELFYRIS